MVDMGIFQGDKAVDNQNYKLPSVDIRSLNVVIISQAHLYHTGHLPLIARSGYKGLVFATSADERSYLSSGINQQCKSCKICKKHKEYQSINLFCGSFKFFPDKDTPEGCNESRTLT